MDLPLNPYLNAEIDSASNPARHHLLLASVKAGIVQELFYRNLLVSSPVVEPKRPVS